MKSLFLGLLLLFSSTLVEAKFIGQIKFQTGAYVLLSDEQRQCPDNMVYYEYYYPKKDGKRKMIRGCWTITPIGIYLTDEEGSSAVLPFNVVEKLIDIGEES